MKLSEQAKWYLRGNWPVCDNPVWGNYPVEPRAIQELINAGLVEEHKSPTSGIIWWLLTDNGKEVKKNVSYLASVHSPERPETLGSLKDGSVQTPLD